MDLDEIAVEVSLDREQGRFLRYFALAWLCADRENKGIMMSAWGELVDKYGLEVKYTRGIPNA